MTEAVGDAFTIENVTAVDEFLLESLSSLESKAGTLALGLSMETPFAWLIVHLLLWASYQSVKAWLS